MRRNPYTIVLDEAFCLRVDRRLLVYWRNKPGRKSILQLAADIFERWRCEFVKRSHRQKTCRELQLFRGRVKVRGRAEEVELRLLVWIENGFFSERTIFVRPRPCS